ncbi:MAG: lysophospholipid acyltransferase family protein [Syntrophales bacterium]|jgi:1-acyl-sn-glycerol-3-phosphate acyltransferase
MIITKLLYALYQPYKWLVFLPIFILSTVFFILFGMLILVFTDSNTTSRTAGVWWARFICFITPIRVTVLGRDNVIREQSYIVAANHNSLYDILILYGFLGIDIKWAMKVELRRIPLFGLAGKLGGNIYIDRPDPAASYASLRAAKETLVKGVSLMMLPEGTRSRRGELRPFKNGAFILSSELSLPILPVSIIGTAKVLPPNTLKLFPKLT